MAIPKQYIYLDDVRVPVKVRPDEQDWVVVRSYEEFVDTVLEISIENVELISLDHDLGPRATQHFLRNTTQTYEINYGEIPEKTGLDCAKWLVDHVLDNESKLPVVVVHSANPVGSANIMGYINNYLYVNRLPQSCIRVNIEHTVDNALARKQGWE